MLQAASQNAAASRHGLCIHGVVQKLGLAFYTGQLQSLFTLNLSICEFLQRLFSVSEQFQDPDVRDTARLAAFQALMFLQLFKRSFNSSNCRARMLPCLRD